MCGLSYLGDVRMGLAEDKNKVQRIVAGSAPGLHALYRSHLEQARRGASGSKAFGLEGLTQQHTLLVWCAVERGWQQRARPAHAVLQPLGAGVRMPSAQPLLCARKLGRLAARSPYHSHLELAWGWLEACMQGSCLAARTCCQGLSTVSAIMRTINTSREASWAVRVAHWTAMPMSRKVLPRLWRNKSTQLHFSHRSVLNPDWYAQGQEGADARLQRAPGGMWVQDTTMESRRRLVASLPQVSTSCGAGLCAAWASF